MEFELHLVTRHGQEKAQARNARLIEGGTAQAAQPTLALTGRRGRPGFWSPGGFGFVLDEESGGVCIVAGTSVPGGYLHVGDLIQFDVEAQTNDQFQAVNVSVLEWGTVGEPFADQLDMGSPRWAFQLAELAERRTGTTSKSRPRTGSRSCGATSSTRSCG